MTNPVSGGGRAAGGAASGGDPTGATQMGTQALLGALSNTQEQAAASVEAGRSQTQSLIDNTTTNAGTEGYSPQALASAGGDAKARTGSA